MEALSILKKEAVPDLILSDIMMPRLDGIGLYEQVSKDPILTAVPFIFLTARDEPDERLKQLRQGAVHYILKPFSIEELKAVIGSTLRIHESARGGMLEKLKNALMGMGQTPYKERETVEENPYPEDITSREREILDLVVQGLSDKEIADRLGLSTRTASNHVASILRKTGLSSRQSLRQRFEKRPVAEWTGAT
jgi:DNA-binding NarL/FixJ family response regulator